MARFTLKYWHESENRFASDQFQVYECKTKCPWPCKCCCHWLSIGATLLLCVRSSFDVAIMSRFDRPKHRPRPIEVTKGRALHKSPPARRNSLPSDLLRPLTDQSRCSFHLRPLIRFTRRRDYCRVRWSVDGAVRGQGESSSKAQLFSVETKRMWRSPSRWLIDTQITIGLTSLLLLLLLVVDADLGWHSFGATNWIKWRDF